MIHIYLTTFILNFWTFKLGVFGRIDPLGWPVSFKTGVSQSKFQKVPNIRAVSSIGATKNMVLGFLTKIFSGSRPTFSCSASGCQ